MELFRRVMGLGQDLDGENAKLEATFRAAASRAGAQPGGAEVAEVHARTVTVERLVSTLSAASSELLQAVATGGATERKLRKSLNTAHLQNLISRGLQLRMAAKQFLIQVLVKSDCLAVPMGAVAVTDAGALGKGLFAASDIGPGRKVGEYVGEHLDAAGLTARYGETAGDYVLRTSETWWIDAGDESTSNVTRYINHAAGEAANCVLFGDDDRRMIVFTSRPVARGSQLLMDYGPDFWRNRSDELFVVGRGPSAEGIDSELGSGGGKHSGVSDGERSRGNDAAIEAPRDLEQLD